MVYYALKEKIMEKIVGDWSTEVRMSGDEAKEICNLGKGSECCAFIVVGGGGFECAKGTSVGSHIFRRLKEGTMNAKREGGWKGCAWERSI
jgi:hypothetical protein